MPEPRHCPECGAPLPADVPDGVCPACSLGGALALSPNAPNSLAEKPGDRVGRYKLLQQIGEGGCGVVYMAEQEEPVRRRVALKIIKLGMDTRQVIARFEAERQALAMMDHPNIAKVLDADATETGRPYFVMELVRGVKITEYCDENNLSTRERLELFMQVCQAIQHAHQKGIIHRDIKPSNILVTINDDVAVPKVIDFGVAKATGQQRLTDKTLFTAFEQFIGTPAYMSPEQAMMTSLDIDTRSDIYSLGVLLYELLTGTTTFDSKELLAVGLDELRRTIREKEPAKPSTRLSTLAHGELTRAAKHRQTDAPRLIHAIRGDIDWIVMKCLEKDRARRYGTARELADELGRVLRNEPILTRPVSQAEKAWRWTQRNPKAATVTAAFAVIFLLIFGGVLWQLDGAKVRAEQDRQQLVRFNVAMGVGEMDSGDLLSSLPWLTEALRLDRGHEAAEKVHRLRLGTVLHQSPRLMHAFLHNSRINYSEFSPDGRWVVTASGDGTARVWDTETSEPVTPPLQHAKNVRYASFSPDGRYIVTASADTTARVWNAKTGEAITPPIQHPFEVTLARFSPDGKRILTVSYFPDEACEARVWDAATGRPITTPMTQPGTFPINHAAFSPDGQKVVIAIGSTDRFKRPRGTQVRDANTGAPLTDWEKHGDIVWPNAAWCAVFSPDGDSVLIATEGRAELWDASLTQRKIPVLSHQAQVNWVNFSPNGRRIVTASMDGTARVWDTLTGEPVTPPLRHASVVNYAAFSPDGRRVITASQDHTVRIWAADSGEQIGPPLEHLGLVFQADFSPDGSRVVSSSEDHMARVWGVPRESATILHQTSVQHATFSPDGSRVATGTSIGDAAIWDVGTGQLIRRLHRHTNSIAAIIFSPDGRRLLTVGHDSTGQIWDAVSGEPAAPSLQHSNAVTYGTFSPDGKRVATASKDRTARVWNGTTGEPLTPPLEHKDLVRSAEFSPDGRRLLTTSGDMFSANSEVRLWDAATGAELPFPVQHSDSVLSAFFSPEGQRIVTASADQTARIWDAASGQPLVPPMKHNGVVIRALFSSDGRRIVTASSDHTARVWDAATGEPITPPLKESGIVRSVAWSPDGRFVVTAGVDSTARVWDAVTGAPITPVLRHDGRDVVRAEFDRDSRRVLTVGYGTARIWELRANDWPAEDLIRQAEVLSSHRILPNGESVPLEASKLRQQLQQLREKYPAEFAFSAQEGLSWHRREAEASELTKRWSSAVYHLDRWIEAEPNNAELRERRYRAADWLDWQSRPPGTSYEVKGRIPVRDPRAKPEQIDLSEFYNAELGTVWMRGPQPNNHLGALPRGLQTFDGTEFDVRGVIQLMGGGLEDRVLRNIPISFPKQVTGIAVGRECRRVHFLHGAGEFNAVAGTVIGNYVIHYSKGVKVEVPIVYGQDVFDFLLRRAGPAELSRAVNAWTGTNPDAKAAGIAFQLFKRTWENPQPDMEIESIDFVSTMTKGAPFLIAITVE